ncbi:von Willebrand factor, type A [Plesiocystis pacifica SIR-1]|uniref:von Willebrand factor, type A n=1 Tax=Plesiocystis pacifica SIR-1 TaxID=391625 RepID=A6G7V2_9BACT|nr:von Willebrand factor, type A [Plesiocystis pacifica SIR-1]
MNSAVPTPSLASSSTPSAGARLVSSEGRTLPLRAAELTVEAAAGLGRVVLRQTFFNPHDEPLRLTYQVPLPADAAVSGYAFCFADQRVVGEVAPKQQARERFEDALLEGKSAALLEEERSSLFTQELGNVPPRVEVTCELILDQPLKWLAAAGARGFAGWEWRFPTTVAPRFSGAPGRVADAEKVVVDLSVEPLGPRVRVSLSIADALPEGAWPTSPSHKLNVARVEGRAKVELGGDAGAALDRDVVVRWPGAPVVAGEDAGVSLELARPDAAHLGAANSYGRLVLTPPPIEPGREVSAVPRDLIVLLDTSGSMRGEPLAHAQAVTEALIRSLRDRDRLELVEFSSRVRRWSQAPASMSAAKREEALRWVGALRASGGTHMRDGILAALASLRPEAQRQILLITDGLIAFESEIVQAARQHRPPGCRVHTLGIGSSVNRSLTRPVALAGGGLEVIVAPGEDAEEAAARLVAHMDTPMLVDLSLSGSALREVASVTVPDLFLGAPAQIPVALRPEGGTLTVRGRLPVGSWEREIEVPAVAAGEGSAALVKGFARAKVEALEVEAACGAERDADIERIGVGFQISTRRTSWLAVSEEATVDPSRPTRRETMPHQLPAGMSVAGLGLREVSGGVVRNEEGVIVGSSGHRAQRSFGAIPGPAQAPSPAAPPAPGRLRKRASARKLRDSGGKTRSRGRGGARPSPMPPPLPASPKGESGELGEGWGGAAPARARKLQGRLVRATAGLAVLEVVLSSALTWKRPGQVEVMLDNGFELRAKVEARSSTASGDLEAGQVLRLVLRGAFPGGILQLRFRVGAEEWIIQL